MPNANQSLSELYNKILGDVAVGVSGNNAGTLAEQIQSIIDSGQQNVTKVSQKTITVNNDNLTIETKYTNPSLTIPSSLHGGGFSPDNSMVVSYQDSSSPYVVGWPFETGVGLSTQFSAPSTAPHIPIGMDWHPGSKYVAILTNTSPRLQVLAVDSSTGFGALTEPASDDIGSNPNNVLFSPEGNHIIVATGSSTINQQIKIFPFDDTDGSIGSPSTATTQLSGEIFYLCKDPKGDFIGAYLPFTSPYLAVWSWTGSAIQNKLSNPSSLPSSGPAKPCAFIDDAINSDKLWLCIQDSSNTYFYPISRSGKSYGTRTSTIRTFQLETFNQIPNYPLLVYISNTTSDAQIYQFNPTTGLLSAVLDSDSTNTGGNVDTPSQFLGVSNNLEILVFDNVSPYIAIQPITFNVTQITNVFGGAIKNLNVTPDSGNSGDIILIPKTTGVTESGALTIPADAGTVNVPLKVDRYDIYGVEDDKIEVQIYE